MESCIFQEECKHRMYCTEPCEVYEKKFPLFMTISALFLACVILYGAFFITYGIGRAAGREEGRQERVSRATCLQYAIELEQQHIKYGWKQR